MATPRISDEDLRERVALWNRLGRNTSALGRELGMARASAQHSLRVAAERGMIDEAEIDRTNQALSEEYLGARERKLRAYEQKKRKGDWRKPIRTVLPYKPFRLVIMGDPHLDDDGCHYEVFEAAWKSMGENAHGLCVGDFFNNWPRALAHLWKESSVAPSDAWVCLEHLMNIRGQYLLAACSGNHDDWTHGPVDPIALIMRQNGVSYREGAIRLLLAFEGTDRTISIAMRHKWKGHSMWSAAHALVKAAKFGWRDNLSIGGHIHQDEPRMVIHDDGFKQHVCQISAFKDFDKYVDVQGHMGGKISPVWHVVVDPRCADEDPDMIKVFWDADKAERYLSALYP